jgi:uncharacterized membrane protein
MNKTRIEAFSDGVMSIIITIMVLEIEMPSEVNIQALFKLLPAITSYLLSFVIIGIYWLNHHHIFQTVKHINGKIIWVNMGFLFTLSLIPISTSWMGQNHFAKLPVVVYTINLLICGFTANLLQKVIISGMPKNDKIFEVINRNKRKSILSLWINILSITIAFFYPVISFLLACLIGAIWIIPDRKIEKLLND